MLHSFKNLKLKKYDYKLKIQKEIRVIKLNLKEYRNSHRTMHYEKKKMFCIFN